LQLRPIREVFSNVNDINVFLMTFSRMSLHCKLVPVQYREYEKWSILSVGFQFFFFKFLCYLLKDLRNKNLCSAWNHHTTSTARRFARSTKLSPFRRAGFLIGKVIPLFLSFCSSLFKATSVAAKLPALRNVFFFSSTICSLDHFAMSIFIYGNV